MYGIIKLTTLNNLTLHDRCSLQQSPSLPPFHRLPTWILHQRRLSRSNFPRLFSSPPRFMYSGFAWRIFFLSHPLFFSLSSSWNLSIIHNPEGGKSVLKCLTSLTRVMHGGEKRHPFRLSRPWFWASAKSAVKRHSWQREGKLTRPVDQRNWPHTLEIRSVGII